MVFLVFIGIMNKDQAGLGLDEEISKSLNKSLNAVPSSGGCSADAALLFQLVNRQNHVRTLGCWVFFFPQAKPKTWLKT